MLKLRERVCITAASANRVFGARMWVEEKAGKDRSAHVQPQYGQHTHS
jgi:hypothetical protein